MRVFKVIRTIQGRREETTHHMKMNNFNFEIIFFKIITKNRKQLEKTDECIFSVDQFSTSGFWTSKGHEVPVVDVNETLPMRRLLCNYPDTTPHDIKKISNIYLSHEHAVIIVKIIDFLHHIFSEKLNF